MSFITSLSGLKAAQTDLATVSNNIANSSSTGFKKSKATFGDLFASAPTHRTLDLAIAGDGFFIVEGSSPRQAQSFTRNGNFFVNVNREVVDNIGNRVQMLPVDANGRVTSTAAADLYDFVLPQNDPADPNPVLSNITISDEGVVSATFSNGTQTRTGAVAMASFAAAEGLRPIGDAHWQSTGVSGTPLINQAGNGPLGTVRSGTLEAANINLTEELVSLIG